MRLTKDSQNNTHMHTHTHTSVYLHPYAHAHHAHRCTHTPTYAGAELRPGGGRATDRVELAASCGGWSLLALGHNSFFLVWRFVCMYACPTGGLRVYVALHRLQRSPSEGDIALASILQIMFIPALPSHKRAHLHTYNPSPLVIAQVSAQEFLQATDLAL